MSLVTEELKSGVGGFSSEPGGTHTWPHLGTSASPTTRWRPEENLVTPWGEFGHAMGRSFVTRWTGPGGGPVVLGEDGRAALEVEPHEGWLVGLPKEMCDEGGVSREELCSLPLESSVGGKRESDFSWTELLWRSPSRKLQNLVLK